jgi:long-chain acyl-CoA synthetase
MSKSDGYDARPWVQWYAPGVAEHLDIPNVPLTELLYKAAEDFPRRKAIAFLGRTMTYRALVQAVERFAGALEELGVRKGDRVALILPNCPQTVISFFAVLRLGAVVVQHNPLYTPPELHHQLSDSGATVAIVYDGAYGRLAEARPATKVKHVIVTSLADYLPSGKRLALHLPFGSVREKRNQLVTDLPPGADVLKFDDLLANADRSVLQIPITPDRDLALLQYTGGTTGRPKGAMLTHRNLVANTYQATAWDPEMERGYETVLGVLPIFHVYGLTMCLLMNMLAAGTLVLLPTFELGLLFKAIDKWKPTVFPGVPPMYDQIVRSRRTAKHDLSSIRTCVSGAMRLPPETVGKFEQATGGRLVEGYGLTESSPVALANPLNENARPGTIGVALPGTDARIADLSDASRDAPFGVAGELCVRGPQVFDGYWQQPEETASMLRDGWLQTGDIAVMDEQGFVTIVDRKRDVINASGFSIFPSEIEDVLSEHPAIEACAVAGVPHFYRGETVKAFVIIREDERVTETELHDYCAARLVAYKVPAQFEFRKELPRNILGKILRRVLRAEDEAARRGGTQEIPVVLDAPAALPAVDDDAPATQVIPVVHDALAPDVIPSNDGERPEHDAAPAETNIEAAVPDDIPDSRAGPGQVEFHVAMPAVPRHGLAEQNGHSNGHAGGSLVDELERLVRLRDMGALTEDEFHAAKLRLLHIDID